jgi:nucleotide-binding universal stress UspA family protein
MMGTDIQSSKEATMDSERLTEPLRNEAVGAGPLLVGVDSSKNAQNALAWSGDLAERISKSVIVAHASSPWIGLGMAVPPFDYESYKAVVADSVEEWANSVGDVLEGTRIVEDDAAEGLLVLAGEVDPSVLVLGAHPKRHWTPNVLGSTTAKVLHGASVPVAVVPSRAPAELDGRSLVAGVDGSPASLRALRWAADLGRKLGTSVYAVTAYPLEPYAAKPRLADDDSDDPVGHTLDALRLLTAQVSRESGGEIHSDVVLGHPAERLIETAGDHGYALVVGKTGQGTFTEVALGSTGRSCATHSSVPVFVIP